MDNQLIPVNRISKGDKYIPQEYVTKLYEAADTIKDRFYLMWHIETGVRVSDIVGQVDQPGKPRLLGQEVNNIDWDHNRIWTYDHKKDKWRWVYFPQKVRVMLKLWMRERETLKIKDRQLFPFSEKTCNRILKKWCKNIGFPWATLVSSHWCRHTFIRLSRAADRDIKAVQQNTGDTIKTLLEWYSDLSMEDMANEMDKKPISI